MLGLLVMNFDTRSSVTVRKAAHDGLSGVRITGDGELEVEARAYLAAEKDEVVGDG